MVIIKKLFYIVILSEFLGYRSFCSETCKPKVAIIGAGIGGASASYFLTKLFEENLEIDVFESKAIGGRLATVKFDDEEFEAGGAIIHSKNKYMKDFVKLLNLQTRSPQSGNTFDIWNGKDIVFKESNWKIVTFLKLIYRYGLQPIHLYRYISTILYDFEKIYDLQDQGVGFENVTALLNAMNRKFINLLQLSIKDHLTYLGYGTKLINELVKATIVTNYGQDTNVHAFVAYVSVAGAGFNLWSVNGGNKKIPKNLFSYNQKVSIIYSTVERINRLIIEDVPKYEIFYKKNAKQVTTSKVYDIIIIATPLTTDQETPVTFIGFKNPDLKFLGKFQTTYATFIAGKVNTSYFRAKGEFENVLSCNPDETKISSITRISSVKGTKDKSTQVWKIFSRHKLDNSIIYQMFSLVNEIREVRWKAYPQYTSTIDKFRNDKFKLDNSMYYVNAIEWVASAIEMSAISGRNAAILAFNDYQRHCFLQKNFMEKESKTHSSEL